MNKIECPMQKFISLILLLVIHNAIKGQSKYELLYWFDSETKYNCVAIEENVEMEFDVQHLNVGLHTLFLQIKDDKGTLSSPVTKSFYRVALKNQEIKVSYWFDGDDDKKQTDVVTDNTWKCNIDVDSLDAGLHRFYVQVLGSENISYSVAVKDFFRVIPEPHITSYIYWFNEDTSNAQKGTLDGDIIWLDVSALPDGFHTLYIQAEQCSASTVVAHSFIKVPQTDAVGELTCLIFIDNKLYQVERVEPQGGLLNLNIDVTSLSQGVHTLEAYVVTPTGAATNVSSHVFTRSVVDGETGINETLEGVSELGIYNINGVKIKALDRKGIYIINNKKVYIGE